MVSPREIRAGGAFIELYLQDRMSAALKAAQRKLRAFGQAATNIGRQLLKATAVLGAPFVAGAKVFADFDRQMAMVSTMLDEPQKHMERFRKGIRDMSVEFGESTDTLAKGLYDVLSALIPPEHAMTVLAAATKAATAGLTDTQTAARSIITILNSFGISADKAGQVSDLLFMIVRRGVTTFGELAPQVGRVASTAAAAGVGLDEFGAVLSTITRAGVQTENAVVAVNQIMMRFLKPTSEAAKLAKELGFEMSSATLKSEGLVGVFKRLSALPPEMIAKLFPNVRALRGVIPALKHMEGLEQDVKMMRNSAGATEAAYQKMAATLAFAFARAKQAAVNVLRSIGEALAGPLKAAGTAMVKYSRILADFISRHKAAVVAVAKVVLIVGAAGAAFIAIGVTAKLLAVSFGVLAGVVSAAASAIGLLASALAALTTPAGLALAAVGALGLGIIYATAADKDAVAALGKQFGKLKDDAMAAYDGIKDALASGDIGLAAKILWLTLKKWWAEGVGWLTGIWYDFKYVIIKTLTEAFYGAVKGLAVAWAAIQRAWVDVTSFLAGIWSDFCTGIQTAWEVSQTWLAKRFVELQGLFDDTLDVEDAKKGLESRMNDALSDIAQKQKAKQREIDEDREKRTRAIDQEEAGTIAELSKEADAAKQKQLDEYTQSLAKAESDLAQAKKEWADALAAAKEKRTVTDETQEDTTKAADAGADLFNRLKGLSGALAAAGDAVGVRGTFSALEARGLGAGSAMNRIADATEETADNTDKIVDELEDGGTFV